MCFCPSFCVGTNEGSKVTLELFSRTKGPGVGQLGDDVVKGKSELKGRQGICALKGIDWLITTGNNGLSV